MPDALRKTAGVIGLGWFFLTAYGAVQFLEIMVR
jgi:hypothetical protein